jgi:hypothetical protein
MKIEKTHGLNDKIMKATLLLLAAILTISCARSKPKEKHLPDGTDIEVELLFEHDGCKVYRFWDKQYIYYTDCRGQTQSFHTKHTGKTSVTVTDFVSTVE